MSGESKEIPTSEFADEYEDRLAAGSSKPDQDLLRRAIAGTTLGALPRRGLVSVASTATVAEAVEAMNSRTVGCTLVMDGDALAGIFTERDLLRRVIGKGLDVSAPVKDVMTADPETLPETATLAYALNKMSVEGYRHVPLVDEADDPVDVVSQRDIIDWLVEMLPASVLNLPPEPHHYPTSVDGC